MKITSLPVRKEFLNTAQLGQKISTKSGYENIYLVVHGFYRMLQN